jgi:hypothetical protein
MEMAAAQRGPTAAGCESQQRTVSRTIFFGQQLNQKL